MIKKPYTIGIATGIGLFLTIVFGVILVYTMVSCALNSEPNHIYKIQRLNNSGEVMQTYYSGSFPWGTDHTVSFYEYSTGKLIKLGCPYTAENLGTNLPTK